MSKELWVIALERSSAGGSTEDQFKSVVNAILEEAAVKLEELAIKASDKLGDHHGSSAFEAGARAIRRMKY